MGIERFVAPAMQNCHPGVMNRAGRELPLVEVGVDNNNTALAGSACRPEGIFPMKGTVQSAISGTQPARDKRRTVYEPLGRIVGKS